MNELLCDSLRVASHCEDSGALSQILVRAVVPPTHRPLRPDLAAELQEPGGETARWVQCLQE